MKCLTEFLRIVLPVVILTGGVVGFAAISSLNPRPERVEPQVLAPLVRTLPIQQHTKTLDLKLDGTVVPYREITLSSEIAGRIVSKSADCRAGRYVTAGTLLVEIDAREYQLEVERLQEEVKQADANLNELQVDIENAESLIELAHEETLIRQRELRRVLGLQQDRAISESAVDDAKRFELTARNSAATLQNQLRKLDSSRARLESAKELTITRLKQAELNVERTSVRAPIDGVIVRESIEENSFVPKGAELFIIDDISAAEVRCSLRVEELDWVLRQRPKDSPTSEMSPNSSLSYELPATKATVSYRTRSSEFRWEGELSRYEGIGLDAKTRTTPCRILVRNPREVSRIHDDSLTVGPNALVRGMYVNVVLHIQPQQTMLALPEQVVQPGNKVFCVRNGQLKTFSLRETSLTDGFVLTPAGADGLQLGDLLIVTPIATPIEGMELRTENVSDAAPQEVAGR